MAIKPVIEIDEAKELAITKSIAYTDSIKMTALTIGTIISPDGSSRPDIKTTYQQIDNQLCSTLNGDTDIHEVMLYSQAKILDLLFNEMINRAVRQGHIDNTKAYFDMAFRAQNQCRKTLLAINAINHPNQQTVVKQQNVAFNQQVNNGTVKDQPKIKSENELISEARDETLDFGRTLKTSTANKNSKTMAMVNRREDDFR